jgi:hypothetical protein
VCARGLLRASSRATGDVQTQTCSVSSRTPPTAALAGLELVTWNSRVRMSISHESKLQESISWYSKYDPAAEENPREQARYGIG